MVIFIKMVYIVSFSKNYSISFKEYTIKISFSFLIVFGWCLSAFGIGQLIIWALYAVHKSHGNSWWERFVNSFKPQHNWGPSDPNVLKVYKLCMDDSKMELMFRRNGFWYKVYDNIFG